MATPTTGNLNVVGSAGGMAPFPTSVYADIEGVGSTWATGSGTWPEGRWAFQLIDDATGQVYDSGRMDLQCPMSSVTATAYNRYGAGPNAGCVVYDPGTYYWRVKYQNRDGDFSTWANSATFTVAANTRTKIYVDGNAADDSGNGLTSGTAKKTLNATLALINGDDFEVILKDDTSIDVTAGTDISSRSGIWVHRSGDGTSKPTIVGKNTSGAVYAIICGSDTVVEDFVFGYDGVAGRLLFSLESNRSNVAWCNIDTEYINAFAQIPTGTSHQGLVIYGCTMIAQALNYMLFVDGPSIINILGCVWDKGSELEHTIRTMWQDISVANTKFVSIDFCTLDQANRGKTMLRPFHKRFLGVYRCDLRNGSLSVGNLDATAPGGDQTIERFEDYRFDCCRLLMENTDSGGSSGVSFHEGLKNVIMASCHVYKDTLQTAGTVDLRKRSGASGNVSPLDNLQLLNCVFAQISAPQASVFDIGFNSYTAELMTGFKIRGCALVTTETVVVHHYNEQMLVRTGIPSTFAMNNNVVWLPTHLNPAIAGGVMDILDDLATATAYKSIATLNAESWASENIQEQLVVNSLTAELSGSTTGWQTLVTDITGLFESINGEVFDRTDTTWAAGAWQPVGSGTGGVAGYPTDDLPEPTITSYLGLSAGGSFIVLQT